MTDIERLGQIVEQSPAGPIAFWEIWSKREANESCWERGSFSECRAVAEGAQEKADPPLTESESSSISSPLLGVIPSGNFHNLYQKQEWRRSWNQDGSS